jgi:hypothetical protein
MGTSEKFNYNMMMVSHPSKVKFKTRLRLTEGLRDDEGVKV